jgi:hypothetical protein
MTFPFTVPGPLVVASPSQLLIPVPVACTFHALQLVLAGAPSGAAAAFDVLYNATAKTPGAAMTSIYAAGSKPAIAAGALAYWNTNAPDTTSFIQDSLLRIDVTGIGSTSPGKGLTGLLTVTVP